MRSVDRASLAVLLGIWTVSMMLSLSSAVRLSALSPVYVTSEAYGRDYPRVVGFKEWLANESAHALRTDDVLLRVGEFDLRGVGPIGFHWRLAKAGEGTLQVEVLYSRGARTATTTLQSGSFRFVLPILVVSTAFMLVGLAIYLRAPATPTNRMFALANTTFAIAFASYFVGGELLTRLAFIISVVSFGAAPVLMLRALQAFPDRYPGVGGVARVASWGFAVYGPLQASNIYGTPIPPHIAAPTFRIVFIACALVCLLTLTSRYLHTDAIGRRKLRWIVFGCYLAAIPLVASAAAATVDARLHTAYFASLSFLALVPASMLISIVRYNLFDVDRLISATASYNVLAVLAGVTAVVVLPTLSDIAVASTPLEPRVGEFVFSIAIVWLVIRGHRRLRPRIERIFFPERYRVDLESVALIEGLSRCADPGHLLLAAGAGLERLMRPEVTAVYVDRAGTYEPVFASGRAVPPVVGPDHGLIERLRNCRGAIDLAYEADRRIGPSIEDIESATLATLAARVAFPIRRAQKIVGFVLLGPKRSGDIYTSTDMIVIGALANELSTELARFDDAAVIRDSTSMQDALRSYVPGAVVEHLETGRDLTPTLRQLSVLFVDLRDFTSLSNRYGAQEIFSTINLYTTTVSAAVRKHGGSIVEFNGDGMMAVFGAPDDLPGKEHKAVAAAREILGELERLGTRELDGAASRLRAGVGIATGQAVVGNVQAADRKIWTALGRAVNLAARLEDLTKVMQAAIVVDKTTWQALGAERGTFSEFPSTAIRGFDDRFDLFAIPAEGENPTTV